MARKEPTCGAFHVRKWYVQDEEVLANETGRPADGPPLRRIVVAAAVHNPFAGEFVQDLGPVVGPSGALGAEFGRRVQAALGGDAVQSYGKACLVGAAGEYEHGNAFLTQIFADPVREAVGGGKSWVPSTGKVAAPGASLDIPLAHKDALYVRANYDTVTVAFGDAPRADEVVIAFAFATRGRLHARLGGLAADDVVGEDGLR
ncbi:amino acid synthesis family protein [Nocardioides hungaricus]